VKSDQPSSPTDQTPARQSPVRRVWKHLSAFVEITERRHIFLLAAGIAFNQLICLIPFLLIAISIASSFISEEATRQAVLELIVRLVPSGTSIDDMMLGIVREVSTAFRYTTLAGWIAGGVLLWTSSALFSSLRTGLNAIFHIATPKLFLLYKLKDIGFVIVSTVLITATTLVTPILSLIENYGASVLPDGSEGLVFGLGAQLVSITATTVLFLTLYGIVPNARLPRRTILLSTVAAVLLWEGARLLFTWYVNTATNFSAFYGGYVAVVSLALWTYYSSLVFLVAAEIGQYADNYLSNRSQTS